MVELDSSVILVEAIKNRSAEVMKRAYIVLLARIKKAGANPPKHIMDNEVFEHKQCLQCCVCVDSGVRAHVVCKCVIVCAHGLNYCAYGLTRECTYVRMSARAPSIRHMAGFLGS